jgi:hypothetical protein
MYLFIKENNNTCQVKVPELYEWLFQMRVSMGTGDAQQYPYFWTGQILKF